jgi:hypothetical protein
MILRFFFLLLLLLGSHSLQAQERTLRAESGRTAQGGNNQNNAGDTPNVKKRDDLPPATDYKIISAEKDTTHVDTTLNIHKMYKANYLRKDNFELLEFHNVAMTYNKLGYDFRNQSLMPDFGAQAQHFNYLRINDIFYYETPTPLTEIYFRNVLEQGQNVKTNFSTNINRRLNFSIGYEGLRSLGDYKHARSNVSSFRGTINYRNKTDRYFLRTHVTSQNLENQHNGGLTSQAIENFINEIPEFENRASLANQFENADSELTGNRLYVNHEYHLVKGDSLQNDETIVRHVLTFEDRNYRFNQAQAFALFGSSFENTNINNRTQFEEVTNTVELSYKRKHIGEFSFKGQYTDFNYGFKSIVVSDESTIPNRLLGNTFGIGGTYKNRLGKFNFEGELMHNIVGDLDASYIGAKIGLQLTKDFDATAFLNIQSIAPNFNYVLNQSSYVNYNWYNPDFNNITSQVLGGRITHQKYGYLEGSFSQIQNFTYFGVDGEVDEFDQIHALVRPFQSDSDVSYLKLKAGNDIDLGLFGINNTTMYQKVFSGASVLPVPEVVTRHSIYYKNHWFNKATYVQTGFNFRYFTDFNSMAFNPVLNEFVVQDVESLNGFYTLDLFFNAKLRTARLFFIFENIQDFFQGNTNFSAPTHPYRDFRFRFGVIWNLFT